MTFATLYIDEGNLLDFHDDRDTALASVLSVLEEHPEVAEDFGMVELDEHGRRVGDFVSGASSRHRPPPVRGDPARREPPSQALKQSGPR